LAATSIANSYESSNAFSTITRPKLIEIRLRIALK
jgi:hypothetical protein